MQITFKSLNDICLTGKLTLQEAVFDWFGARMIPFRLSEDRGVLLDIGGDSYVKIKGAGLRGGKIITTGNTHSGPPYQSFTGPPFCVFDFEGKRLIDYSMGHDNAPRGGMSFCQAYHEWLMANKLSKIVPTVPCVGWGKIEFEHQPPSWFSLHLWPRALRRPRKQFGTEAYSEPLKRTIRLHFEFGITGFNQLARHTEDGLYYSYDLHPLRKADPETTSAISMTCALAWALTIERLYVEAVWGKQKAREIMHEPYKMIHDAIFAEGVIYTDKEIDNFEHWSQVQLAGLTPSGGVTTHESWSAQNQIGISRVMKQILTDNQIAKDIFTRFCHSYPHPL